MKKIILLLLASSCTFSNPSSSSETRELFDAREANSILELIKNVDNLICDSISEIPSCYDNFIDSVYSLSMAARNSYISRRYLESLRSEFSELIDSSLFRIFWVRKEVINGDIRSNISDTVTIWNVNRNSYLKFLKSVSDSSNDFTEYIDFLRQNFRLPYHPEDILPLKEYNIDDTNIRLIVIIHLITFLDNYCSLF